MSRTNEQEEALTRLNLLQSEVIALLAKIDKTRSQVVMGMPHYDLLRAEDLMSHLAEANRALEQYRNQPVSSRL